MGSNLNFKNLETCPPAEMVGGGRPPGNYPLTRQSSVYSLTFDEFQSTVGGIGKDFGSMNMDELLKNIWMAEENYNVGSTSAAAAAAGNGNLQKQGSLTLSRTLSQKTVDEVWKDLSTKGYGEVKDGFGGFNVVQKEPTLGEVTLEEFLVRAGVVREDAEVALAAAAKPEDVGFLHVMNPSSLGFGFPNQPTISNPIAIQSGNLPMNASDVQSQSVQQTQQQRQPQLLPKQPNFGYRSPVSVGMSGPVTSSAVVQNGAMPGGLGMVGLGSNGVTVRTGSPAVSSDGIANSNGDMSSVSPIPYVFNVGLRGRRSAALEKVVERRQRRMIKNRESAARSRARKQAYTMELEAEVAKLKEENEELQKKQAKMLEMHKNQVVQMANRQSKSKSKRQCLRREQTCPW